MRNIVYIKGFAWHKKCSTGCGRPPTHWYSLETLSSTRIQIFGRCEKHRRNPLPKNCYCVPIPDPIVFIVMAS